MYKIIDRLGKIVSVSKNEWAKRAYCQHAIGRRERAKDRQLFDYFRGN